MPRPTAPIPPLPLAVAPQANGYLPVVSTRHPYEEFCLVPVNGDLAGAEARAERIVWWSERDAANAIL